MTTATTIDYNKCSDADLKKKILDKNYQVNILASPQASGVVPRIVMYATYSI